MEKLLFARCHSSSGSQTNKINFSLFQLYLTLINFVLKLWKKKMKSHYVCVFFNSYLIIYPIINQLLVQYVNSIPQLICYCLSTYITSRGLLSIIFLNKIMLIHICRVSRRRMIEHRTIQYVPYIKMLRKAIYMLCFALLWYIGKTTDELI